MSILHIVRSSAFSGDKLKQCLNVLGNNDKLLFIDDGVYNGQHPLCVAVTQPIMALDKHCKARNIPETNKIQLISMTEFVVETEHAEKVVTWQ